MSKAQKIDKAIGWLTIAGAAYFVGTAIAGAIKRKRETTSGIGYANTPNYTLGLLNRYLSSHEIFDVQVVLNDRNKYGHYYVLCGDDQGGRDFYLSPKNIPYFKNYCLRNGIEYEAFYLPEDALSGIGAAKRRIFKELSLAQKAGVDFEKKYDELTDEEIEALQQVSADTGYTETYYKSLQKAYSAISGIGTTYDVVNADGDTVLTWIDDPHTNASYPIYADDAERYAALREAHDIDDDRQWEIESKQRAIEEKRQRALDAEQRATEARKRLAKTRKAGLQQSLFGIGYSADVERELYEIWREQIEYGDTDYDYDTWRAVAGDEYAKDVLRYM